MNTRKIILLTIVFQLFYSLVNAQIKLIGNITTNGIAEYPTHIDSLSKGGYMSMPTIALRDAIPALRRKYGMLVFVQADGVIYKLNGVTLANADWVALSFGATTNVDAGTLSGTTLKSTITGSSLTSVGTITTGVWSGTAIAIANGGTGATTADAARTNLGLVIGTDVQAPLTAGTNYVVPNASITGASKTKLTYDAKGLVTAGADATTADIAASTDKNYVTDAQKSGVLSNTSGTNTGDQTITLTGDVTGTGTGTFTSTLANSGVSASSYGSSTSIPTFSVDAKGRVTTASTASIVADAGTLTGTTLNATVTGSSLTSVGTITSGVWSGTAVAVAKGGTGLTAAGTANQVLTSTESGTLTWTTPSISLTDDVFETFTIPSIGTPFQGGVVAYILLDGDPC